VLDAPDFWTSPHAQNLACSLVVCIRSQHRGTVANPGTRGKLKTRIHHPMKLSKCFSEWLSTIYVGYSTKVPYTSAFSARTNPSCIASREPSSAAIDRSKISAHCRRGNCAARLLPEPQVCMWCAATAAQEMAQCLLLGGFNSGSLASRFSLAIETHLGRGRLGIDNYAVNYSVRKYAALSREPLRLFPGILAQSSFNAFRCAPEDPRTMSWHPRRTSLGGRSGFEMRSSMTASAVLPISLHG
jgi:hypothetical protein